MDGVLSIVNGLHLEACGNQGEIGFEFPFYENSYTQLYIGSNGFLSFGEGSLSGGNKEIPYSFAPNDFIAPFWSDLEVDAGGAVSTMNGSDANGEYFAVNYIDVSKYQSSDLLTFQVLLYKDSGDIWFQYHTLNGNLVATIGIEDVDGLIGLSYPSLPQNSLAIRFQRPAPSAQVKVLSTYQSGLTQAGVREFFLQIKNTGALGPDTYNLTTVFGGVADPGNSAWQITLWKDDGSAQITDTGEIPQGEITTIKIRLEAPSSGSAIGDYTTYRVIATSSQNANKKGEALFQAANPVGHFLAFGNTAGLDLVRMNPAEQKVFDVTSFGSNPSLTLAGTNYFYVWEAGSDIEYAVYSYDGQPVKSPDKLTDNSTADFQTTDTAPSVAVASDGRVGIVWVRRLFDPNPSPPNENQGGQNYNVYFAVLDELGNVLVEPFNITENGPVCDPPAPDCWQGGGDIDVPEFRTPAILATADNRFFISWIDYRINFDGESTDLGYTAFDLDGNSLVPPDDLKNGNPGFDQYSEPRLVELSGQRMLILYSVNLPGSQDYTLHYGVYNINPDENIGNPIVEDSELENANGRNPAITFLAETKILVAWVNSTTNQIECSVLDSDSGDFSGTPIILSDPEARLSNFVSVSAAKDGYGLLSWFDVEGGTRTYYSLVKWTGTQLEKVTPPMISWEDSDLVVRSRTGQWIAPLPDWTIYLPLIFKN